MEDEKLNWANVMRGFEESKKRNEELAAQMAAQLAAQAALMAEIGVRMDAMLDRLEKMFAESKVEQDAQTAAMRAEVAGIGKSNGMFAEDVYFRALWRRKEFAGIHFDDVSDRMKSKIMLPDGKKLEDEFDIVMTNAASVAIVETKFRAREEDVKELAETVAKNFRLLFPAYKDFKIYLGLGALAFEDKAVKKAREFGIGLIRRVEDNIVYAADWEVKAY
ncbi:MAG: hypothetical protein LBC59_01745 [Chitinispirillales bacterium]|jgi:hypothetical protein|nr:hypothetical protein [Chitinispirillales bacterium]